MNYRFSLNCLRFRVSNRFYGGEDVFLGLGVTGNLICFG